MLIKMNIGILTVYDWSRKAAFSLLLFLDQSQTKNSDSRKYCTCELTIKGAKQNPNIA